MFIALQALGVPLTPSAKDYLLLDTVPEGRNQPLVDTTFSPPIGASFPGARVSFAVIGSPASSVAVTASGESFLSRFFCSGVAAASMRV